MQLKKRFALRTQKREHAIRDTPRCRQGRSACGSGSLRGAGRVAMTRPPNSVIASRKTSHRYAAIVASART